MAIDEVKTYVATNGVGSTQIHTWGGGGYTQINQTNTLVNLGFSGITNYSHGHHVRTGGGHDVINFRSLPEVENVVVGRIEDFDYSRDEVRINGITLDLRNLPSNVRIVEWNGDHNDSGAAPQQWLLIDTGPGYIFYSLEGARVDMNGDGGSNEGRQETHFADGFPNLSTLSSVDFVDPQNFVPEGFSVSDGGTVINDYDHNREDVLATIYGTSGGDLIAAGLNNDRVEATGGHDRVWGGSGNDTVLGGDGHDTVSGGNGADSLLGDNGNDLIQGGLGNDTLNGGGGVDTLLFTGTTAVRVSLDVTTGQATGYGTDVVSNFENVTGGNGADSLSGNAVANVLIGNGGADTLRGGSGADILTGGAGRDLLYGGGGADRDVFVFSATTETAAGTATRDLVYNFVSGQDDLDLRGIDANSAASGDQAFTFNGKIAKANAIWFVVSGTDVIVRGDVNGNTTADFEIQLSGVSALAAADFLL